MKGRHSLDTPLPLSSLFTLSFWGKGLPLGCLAKQVSVFPWMGKNTAGEDIFQRYVSCSQSGSLWVSAKKENQLSSIPKIKVPWRKEKGGGTAIMLKAQNLAFSLPSRYVGWLFLTRSSHKTFGIERFPARKQKSNRPIPQWIWMKTSHKIRNNSKRRHWRRSKPGL